MLRVAAGATEQLVHAPTPTPPCPASCQVLQFVKGEEYARFTRIVFDTAPTGHTLRLLTVSIAWKQLGSA